MLFPSLVLLDDFDERYAATLSAIKPSDLVLYFFMVDKKSVTVEQESVVYAHATLSTEQSARIYGSTLEDGAVSAVKADSYYAALGEPELLRVAVYSDRGITLVYEWLAPEDSEGDGTDPLLVGSDLISFVIIGAGGLIVLAIPVFAVFCYFRRRRPYNAKGIQDPEITNQETDNEADVKGAVVHPESMGILSEKGSDSPSPGKSGGWGKRIFGTFMGPPPDSPKIHPSPIVKKDLGAAATDDPKIHPAGKVAGVTPVAISAMRRSEDGKTPTPAWAEEEPPFMPAMQTPQMKKPSTVPSTKVMNETGMNEEEADEGDMINHNGTQMQEQEDPDPFGLDRAFKPNHPSNRI